MKKRIAPINIDPNDRLPGTGTKSTPSSDDIWAAMRKFVDEHGHQFGKDPTSTTSNLFGESDFIDKFTNSDNSSGNFDDIMRDFYDRTGHSGETNIDQLLAAFFQSYFTQGGNSVTTERNDMLLQFLLQILSTKDQRAFDISQLEDSRLYSSPTNELARLMAAGIGRDAAIQILSGSAGGNSVGVAGSAGSAPGVPAPSGTMDLQRTQVAIGGVQAAVQMLSSLVNTGMSLAQGISQVNMLQSQSYLSQQDVAAYNASSQMYQALNNAIASGSISQDDVNSWSNAQDMLSYFLDHKDTKAFAPVFANGSYDAVTGTLAGQRMFNNQWRQVRDTRDAGSIADEFLRSQRLSNAIASLQPAKIAAEMELIGSQQSLADQQIIESVNKVLQGEAQISVLNSQNEYIQVQTDSLKRTIDAQVNLLFEQLEGQRIENKASLLNYEYNEAGFPMMKQHRINYLTEQLDKWNITHTGSAGEGYRRNQIRAWLMEPANAADAAYLQSVYMNSIGDFASRCPQLFELATAFQASHVFDLIKVGAEIVPAGKALKFVP